MPKEPAAKVPVVVLDSWILLCWLKDQRPAADVMEGLWSQAFAGRLRLAINIVNAGEVFYMTQKVRGQDAAELVLSQLHSMPLEIRPVSNALVWEAARLKGEYAIAYADAFAAATAMREHAPLVTGDPEMKALEGRVRLQWVKSR
jgi:predicted nucleic acid-binding protein